MKITFILPALGYHQIPICSELSRILGKNFNFIATEKISNGRFGVDYHLLANNYDYVIKSYESEELFLKAKEIIINSNLIVIGSSPKIYTNIINKNKNLLIFRYSERFFKMGTWRRFLPKTYMTIYNQFIKQKNNEKFAVLCASAYTSYDLSLISRNIQCYKWGYFPEFFKYDLNKLIEKKKSKKFSVLWAGRFEKWKHCEDAIELARKLKNEDFDFELNIIGDGKERKSLYKLMLKYNLSDCVHFLGSMDTFELRSIMEVSNAFLFTSDFNEGWGAVLNEAMNSACICFASHAIGSSPFLIRDGVNGFIYKNRNIDELFSKMKNMMKDEKKVINISINAYSTIQNEWNHKIAAERLILLTERYISNSKNIIFNSGPLSDAQIIKNSWYGGELNDSIKG